MAPYQCRRPFTNHRNSYSEMKSNAPNAGPSIFQGGKLKPGIYKIRNLVSQTYVDIKDDVRELCGRPSTVLESEGSEVRL